MASTFVNDLRLNEMATGDESGNWGVVTNQSLELIGEALGYGTEGITTNADTHTSTIADGATDPVRAMYVKYTGTLDSACTITIAPNTINRMHFIENGTSGSQNIIISQGSGANITIPPGDTKAVYLDGAGGGAAVVDAFASLNVVDLKVQDDLTVTDDLIVGGDIDLEGAIDVNGTANLDVVDIDGAVDMASTLQVDGAITNSSTIVSTGKITADAGIDIDNFNIDGTTIALSSGNFTLDVAADIIFDAGGSDITLSDDGTEFGRFKQVSNGMRIATTASDADMTFTGNDGGSEITALTLDMSAAGAATFNDKITAVGTSVFTNLDISGDIDVDGTSNLDIVDIDGAVDMASTLAVAGDMSLAANIIHTGDTDTSIGFDTNTINFTTGNVVGMSMLSGVNYMAGTPTEPSGSAERSYIYHKNVSNTSLHIGNQYGNDAAAIHFETANTIRASIMGSGGLTFNGDTAAANALDDYEEGTFAFTSTTISGATGAIAIDADNDQLAYTKIGNRVHISGNITVESNSAGGGRVNFIGLPFTSTDGTEGSAGANFYVQITAGTGSQASGYFSPVGENGTTIQVQRYTGVGSTNDSAATMAADSVLHFSGTYISG